MQYSVEEATHSKLGNVYECETILMEKQQQQQKRKSVENCELPFLKLWSIHFSAAILYVWENKESLLEKCSSIQFMRRETSRIIRYHLCGRHKAKIADKSSCDVNIKFLLQQIFCTIEREEKVFVSVSACIFPVSSKFQMILSV